MISLKSKYGLKAVVSLAANHGKGFLQAKEIASQQDVPVRYLELLLSHLRRARLVNATRGKNGGYILTKTPSSISVWDVVSIYEGKTVFTHDAPMRSGKKMHEVYTSVWREAENRVVEYLKSVKISDIAEAISTGKEMYHI
jgi:Rrf2 family protein